jgi:drug/metabolite transporter (DMT)-like permease
MPEDGPHFGGSALASCERSEDGPAVTGVSLSVGVGLSCALLSALGTNLAFLFKYKGAVAAPDVEMRHPLRSAVDLFRSKWWSIGWGVAAVAFALHVAALTLAPLSIGQAVLAGGLVFLAVLAERFFGFELGRRQWIGIGLVAVSLALLTLTGGGGGGAHSGYSLAGMIVFEGIAVGVGLILVVSHLIERIPVQRGVLLGIAAGLGFGISDVAIKALSGDLESGPVGLLSPWSVVILTAAVFSFYASARSLQIGDGVAVIAVTSVAANLSTILAGLAVFGDRLGNDAFVIGVRLAAFAMILVGAALIPAPVRAGEALEESAAEPESPPRAPPEPTFPNIRRALQRSRCPGSAFPLLAFGADADDVPGQVAALQTGDEPGAGIELPAAQPVTSGGRERVVVVVPGLAEGERREPGQVA